MNNIRNSAVKIFSQIMDMDENLVSDDSSPDNIEGWDSLTHIELISSLEEEFSIQISPEDSIEFENFQMIVSFLEKK